jgi:hypothetical protein
VAQWDLAKALHKKAEVETARLQDFAFHQRARAIGLIARAHGLDPVGLAASLSVCADTRLLHDLAAATGHTPAATAAILAEAMANARRDLIAEQGDPSPHRLA